LLIKYLEDFVMRDEGTFVGVTFSMIVLSGTMFITGHIFGAGDGAKNAVNRTTIECIEKSNICEDRYQYLKLGEKLEKNK
jgi:hypothetical protein